MEEKQEIILFDNIEFYRINDFPNYAVSRCGKVLSLKSGRWGKIKLLKPTLNWAGYYYVSLYNGKYKLKKKFIARIVAETFIANLDNKRTVNHKDGNTKNNNLDNLEWMTDSENHKHAYKYLGRKTHMEGKFGKLHHRSRKINQYTKTGEFIKTWNSVADIVRELNLSQGNISSCCIGKYKSVGNYLWKYQ